MIDLTSLKAPGWGRVVQELSAPAPDDRAFLERLLAVLAQVSAARQGVLFSADRREGDEVEPRPLVVWPPHSPHAPAGNGDGNGSAGNGDAAAGGGAGGEQIEFLTEAKRAARDALTSGQARAFGLDKADQYYDVAPGQGTVLAVPLGSGAGGGGGPATAAITLLLEPRSKDAIRSSLAMAEVLAGYVTAHGLRQSLRRTQQASFAFDLATRLIASINTAPSFKGAAMQLTNDLAKQFSVDRVAIGWVRGNDPAGGEAVRVEAISDTGHFDRRMAMVQKLQAAMDECLDQQQPVLFPPPPAEGVRGDVLLSQAIVHAHRELAAGDAKLKVASLPLRIDEQVVGVVTIEATSEGRLDVGTIELIQSALDLVAPVLRIRRSDDRMLGLRAWDSVVRAGAWVVGPKHTVWKLVGVLVFAAAVFVSVYTTTYRVGADAVLEPRVRRVVSAPMEGVIKSLGKGADGKEIEPGSVVKEGDLLVQFDDEQWRLSALESQKKAEQAELQAAAARKDGDRGKMEQALAQAEQSKAEQAVYLYRVQQAQVKAPISGTILGGKLKDRLGSSVKVGDALMEIAPMDDVVAVAKVDEKDITLVTRAFQAGKGMGQLATKSRPTEAFAFTVEQIVPLAESKEGKNTFEVRAKLGRTEAWIRPGMEARAKFDTERHSLLWIGTRRIVDAVRMWWW